MHRNSFNNGPHSVAAGAAASSAREGSPQNAGITAAEDDQDDDAGEPDAPAVSSPSAVHSESDVPVSNSVVFANNDAPRSSNHHATARPIRRAHSVSAHMAPASPLAAQHSPPPPYKTPLAIATDHATLSPGNAGSPQTTAATATSPVQDLDPSQGLTFLPFDHLDPDYQPVHHRFPASEEPPSTSTRNPFSYLAKRLGGGFKSNKPSWAGPNLTIADGVMANGRAHPYLSPETHDGQDTPLRRFSTTAVNVPKIAARSTAPERVGSNYRSGPKSATATRQGSWQKRVSPHHHHHRQPLSTSELRTDRSLQPYEIAIEDMGLFHDPLFGLPSIDAHTMAEGRMRSMRRSSTSSSASSSDGASATSEVDHPRPPTDASLPPADIVGNDGNHLRRRMTQSSGSSLVSPHLKFPAQPRGRRSLDTLHRRMEAFQRHNHPLPAAINPLGRPTRMAEALYMRSDWKRQLFLFTEDPSSGTWAFIFNVTVCALIFISVVVSVVETLPSVFFWNPNFWFYTETVFVALFTLEYIVRLLAHSDSLRQFLRHVFSFLSIVDLAAIVPYYVQIGIGRDVSNELHFTGIRVIRLFRLFNVFKYISSLQLSIEILIIAIQRSLEALIVLTFFMILSVMIFGTFLYFIERGTYDEATQNYINSKGDPSKFDSIPAALWFSIAALTTTGFGDVTPVTSGGKVMAFPLIMSGILLISIPSIIVGREFTVVRQALRLRRRREVQLIQQRQRDAKKREKRRHRKLLGGLLHSKEAQSSPGLSRADTSHTITERAPGMSRPSSNQSHPAPTNPLDAQVIDVMPSTDEERANGSSNTNSRPPSTRSSPADPHQLKAASKFNPSRHFRKGPIDWQSGRRAKQALTTKGKQRSSDPALDLTRTSTEDLRRYSFDEDFVVLAHGYHGVQMKGAKGKKRNRQSSDGSAKPGHSGSKARPKMATMSTSRYAEKDSDGPMLDLDDASSGITTDPEPMPSDDSMEADADDHDCCVNDATRKSLERLPTMLGDMAKALQGVQESQRALERNLVVITQRIDAMETQTQHRSRSSATSTETDDRQITATPATTSTATLARSLSGRENRSATYLASPTVDHNGPSRAVASAHTTPHLGPRRSFTNPPATLSGLPPPHHAGDDAMARRDGHPVSHSVGTSAPASRTTTTSRPPQLGSNATAVLRARAADNRLGAEDRLPPSH